MSAPLETAFDNWFARTKDSLPLSEKALVQLAYKAAFYQGYAAGQLAINRDIEEALRHDRGT